MDKYELQKLRDLPIEGVAERLGLTVVRHKALCPFLQLKELLPNLEHHQLPPDCKDFSDYYLTMRDKPPDFPS